MIITQTPFRMSFFGGGTDMESFFKEHGGAVLSTTFDKYCYVNVRHLPRFFDYSTELSYSKTERVTCIEDMRDEFYLDGLNCEPYSFDAACQQLNREYQKNKNKNEIKSHHYIISFDPRDSTENCLTGKRAQELGLEYAKANFPGHQALVCTHMDGHNGSGNIHVHIVINSLRKRDVPKQPFMERPIDCNDLTELNDLCKTAQANAQAAYERLSQAEDELYKINEQIHYAGQHLSTKEVQQQFTKAIFKKKFRAEHSKKLDGSVQNGSSNAAGWTNISIKPTPSKIRRAK